MEVPASNLPVCSAEGAHRAQVARSGTWGLCGHQRWHEGAVRAALGCDRSVRLSEEILFLQPECLAEHQPISLAEDTDLSRLPTADRPYECFVIGEIASVALGGGSKAAGHGVDLPSPGLASSPDPFDPSGRIGHFDLRTRSNTNRVRRCSSLSSSQRRYAAVLLGPIRLPALMRTPVWTRRTRNRRCGCSLCGCRPGPFGTAGTPATSGPCPRHATSLPRHTLSRVRLPNWSSGRGRSSAVSESDRSGLRESGRSPACGGVVRRGRHDQR